MNTPTHRSYVEQVDHQRVEDLLIAYRIATRIDRYSTLWRLHVLLTSRVWEPAYDTQLWEDANGQIVGFALIWRRRAEDTYLVLDQFVHPLNATTNLADAILTWAIQRGKTLAAQRASPVTLIANECDPAPQVGRSSAFTKHTITQQNNVKIQLILH
jgi:hypothetical protein